MPTYQYACTDCGHAFEQFQSFSDDSLTVCPQCEGRLRKVFNAVGVVFKGSGFYRTDSRSGAGASETGAGTSGGSSTGTNGSTETTSTTPAASSGKAGSPDKAASSSGKAASATPAA